MHILHALDELVDVIASLDLVQALTSLNQVTERAVGANVKHNVDVLLVLEVSVEADHIFVVKRSVDLYLTRQFLTGLCPCEVGFWHDFESPGCRLVLLSLDRLDPANLVAFGKSSFSEVAATLVSDDLAGLVMVFWVHRLDLLFNYLITKVAKTGSE